MASEAGASEADASVACAEISAPEISAQASRTNVLQIILTAQSGKRVKFYMSYVPPLMNEITEDSKDFMILFGSSYAFLKLVCSKIEDSERVFRKVNEEKSIMISGVIYDMTAEFMEDKPKASPPVDAPPPSTRVSSSNTKCVRICPKNGAKAFEQNDWIFNFIKETMGISVENSFSHIDGSLNLQLSSTKDADYVIDVFDGFKYTITSYVDKTSDECVATHTYLKFSAAPIVSIDSQ